MYHILFSLFWIHFLLHSSTVSFAKEASPSSFEEQHVEKKPETRLQNTELQDLLSELKEKSPTEIFEKANQALKDGEYQTAVQVYTALNSLYPFNEYAERAWVGIIKAHADDSAVQKVIRKANQFIRLYPTSQYLEEIYKHKAMAYVNDRDTLLNSIDKIFGHVEFWQRIDSQKLNEAQYHLLEYLNRFPEGKHKGVIEEALNALHVLIAKKECSEIQFYFTRANYMAVYNRVVELFSRHPNVRDMLGKRDAAVLDKEYQIAKQKLGLD